MTMVASLIPLKNRHASETSINAQPGTVIVGAEWLSQKLDASNVKVFNADFSDFTATAYDPDNRDVKSAFVGYQLADTYYDLQANYRVDDNSQYGNREHIPKLAEQPYAR